MRGGAAAASRRRTSSAGITFVNSTTAAGAGATGTSVTNSVPDGTIDGDRLLWVFSGVGSSIGTPATPTGWGVWQAAVANGTSSKLAIFHRLAASEPASYAASGLTSARWTGIMLAFRGVDQTTPQDTAPTTSASSIQPAITTVTAGAVVLAHGKALSASGVTTSTWATTTGAIAGQKTQVQGANTNDTQATAYQTQAVAGTVTPDLSVSGTTTVPIRVTSALRPA